SEGYMMDELGTAHQEQLATKTDSLNDGHALPLDTDGREQPPSGPPLEKINSSIAKAPEPNPELLYLEKKQGARPGDSYVRVQAPFSRYFRRVGPGHFVATPEVTRPVGNFEKTYRALKAVLIGQPLETSQESHQRLNKIKALAVFGSDAISS